MGALFCGLLSARFSAFLLCWRSVRLQLFRCVRCPCCFSAPVPPAVPCSAPCFLCGFARQAGYFFYFCEGWVSLRSHSLRSHPIGFQFGCHIICTFYTVQYWQPPCQSSQFGCDLIQATPFHSLFFQKRCLNTHFKQNKLTFHLTFALKCSIILVVKKRGSG